MAGLTRDLSLQYLYIEDMAEWQALPGISWLQCSYIEDMAEWQALPGISGFSIHILKIWRNGRPYPGSQASVFIY